jgi:hypothetical protein
VSGVYGENVISVHSECILWGKCNKFQCSLCDLWGECKNFVCGEYSDYVEWVRCYHCMARPQVADGGKPFRYGGVAVNILNKQPQTAKKGQGVVLQLGSWARG